MFAIRPLVASYDTHGDRCGSILLLPAITQVIIACSDMYTGQYREYKINIKMDDGFYYQDIYFRQVIVILIEW